MVYVGGKKKLARYICPILQKELDEGNYDYYIEPFAGGGNIIENIKCKRRIFNDINKELIAFYKAVIDGWEMPEPYSFDREYYNEVKQSWKNKDEKYPDYYYGYVAFIPSFNGLMFGSFAKDNVYDDRLRKYWQEHYESVVNQIDKIRDCEFSCENYYDLKIKDAVIYCDPPYKNTQRRTCFYNKEFDYEKFYNWCREMSKENKIFISECQMPDDFKVIWSKEYIRSLGRQTDKPDMEKRKSVEKLYTL